MINEIIKGIIYFVILVLFQILVLNNIHFLRVATPFLYLYLIIKIPLGTSSSKVLLISFFLGLVIDTFSNTPGMHASACTLIGFLRSPIMQLFIGKYNLPDGIAPSYKTFGVNTFIKYLVTIVVIHHLTLFLIESLSLFDPLYLSIRIVSSSLLTILFICIIETFNNFETKKSVE